MTARTPAGCIVRALALYSLFMLSPVIAWLAGGHLAGWWMLRRESLAWAATGTSMDVFAARWPRRDDSAAAHELERLTHPLGIHVIRLPGRDSQVDDRELYDTMTRYLQALWQTGEDRYEPPPVDVRGYLERHRADVAAAAAYLASAPDIVWETDLDAGIQPPVPSLLAHRQLNMTLLIEAMERHRRGDDVGAGRMLDAAWRHSGTLAGRPEIISQLIAMALTSQQGDVLRRISSGNGGWEERLQERRHHQAIVAGFQADAYSYLVLTREYRGAADIDPAQPAPRGTIDGVVRVFSAPFIQMSFASISRHLRRGRELALTGDPCRLHGDALEKEVSAGIARWNVMTRMVVPSIMRTLSSGVGADLDSELTRLVMQVRRRGGDVPAAVRSSVCQDVSWQQVRGADGRWTIKAAPHPHALDSKRVTRWTFTFSAAARRR